MTLVPNDVIYIEYNDKSLHLNCNGTLFHQVKDDVMEVLEDSNFVSESEIENCTKFILLNKENSEYVVLKYDELGIANITGRIK